jgi:hypothetical protein
MIFITLALAGPLILHHLKGGVLPDNYAYLLVLAEVVLCLLLLLHFEFWMGSLGKIGGKWFRETPWLKAFREARLKHYIILLGIRASQHIPEILAFFIAFRAFKGIMPFTVFLVRFFPAIVIQYMPITIAQLGTSQGGWILMFGKLVPKETLVAFTLSWSLIYFLSRIVLGAIFFKGEARDYFKGDWRNTPIMLDSVEEADSDGR